MDKQKDNFMCYAVIYIFFTFINHNMAHYAVCNYLAQLDLVVDGGSTHWVFDGFA